LTKGLFIEAFAAMVKDATIDDVITAWKLYEKRRELIGYQQFLDNYIKLMKYDRK